MTDYSFLSFFYGHKFEKHLENIIVIVKWKIVRTVTNNLYFL